MQIKIMLWYDVEDYITPEADEALDRLIDMMDKRGVASSLKIVADKARALRNRGRFDIIGKFANHEICYHTDNHSRHPTMTEYLENYGFADGAEEFSRQEEKGLSDLTDIAGQCSTSYGQPGASWAPQCFPALRKWGIPTYLDSHDIIDLNGKPFWYGGLLNLTRLHETMRVDLDKKDGVEEAAERFDRLCAEADYEKTLLVSIYYHPCEFSGTKFWDGINFADGKNTPRPDWRPAPLRGESEMQRRVDMLGSFIDYTLTKENVEYITASQAANHEIRSNANIKREQIENFAGGVGNQVNFAKIGGNWHAPSELLSLMAKYANKKHLTPVLSYGPEKNRKSDVGGAVKICDMAKAFEEQYDKVFGYRQLPDLYKLDNGALNPVDMFCTLASAISMGLGEDDAVGAIEGGLAAEKYVNGNVDWKWLFAKDFKAYNTVQMAKLQAWTLKPACY